MRFVWVALKDHDREKHTRAKLKTEMVTWRYLKEGYQKDDEIEMDTRQEQGTCGGCSCKEGWEWRRGVRCQTARSIDEGQVDRSSAAWRKDSTEIFGMRCP